MTSRGRNVNGVMFQSRLFVKGRCNIVFEERGENACQDFLLPLAASLHSFHDGEKKPEMVL